MDEAIGQRFAIVGDAALLEGFESDAVLLPGVGLDWLAGHGARAASCAPTATSSPGARPGGELDSVRDAVASQIFLLIVIISRSNRVV